MTLPNLSTSTPASEISRADFERDDMANSGELDVPSFDDILKNSPAAEILGLSKEALPDDEEDDALTPGDKEESPENASDEPANKEGEDDQEESKEDTTDEDDTKSTQDAELPTEDDIDWTYKVPVTIDGIVTGKQIGRAHV